MNKEKFVTLLSQQGITLSELQLWQFDTYYKILVEENQKFNLTAITAEDEVYEKHFYDSIAPLFYCDFADKKILDIGTGAGFPGIVIKIIEPRNQIMLIDSNNKKVAFLNKVISELGLSQIEAKSIRAEDYSQVASEVFDIIISRAVAKTTILLEISAQLLKVGGQFIAMKGDKFQAEVDESGRATKLLSLSYLGDKKYLLPLSQADRHLLIYQKHDKTNKKYPRDYSEIKRRPL